MTFFFANKQQPHTPCIRIGHILWTGKKAGAETYVLKLAEGLAAKRQDLKIKIIFFTQAHELEVALKNKGIDFIELHCRSGYDLFGLLRFLWEIFAHKYAILHIHETTAISLLLLKAFPFLKIIYTEHGSILPHGSIRSWLYRQSISACDKVFFVTNRQRKEFHEKLGIVAKYEITLPLGIDLSTYNNSYEKNHVRKSLGYTNDTCIVGYVGRFADFKRVDKVISAVGILKQRIADIRLLIVGFGDHISSLRSLCVSEGVDQCTDFFIAPSNLIQLQQSLDFLVHPSEHESLGLSVLEAMALGKVAIINNFESAHEIISSGNDGIIIDNISPKEIALTITSLWSDPLKRESISRNAIDKICRCFDADRHYDAIFTEYDSLLGNCKKRISL